MSSVSTYLNFEGRTEEAFSFYASVFGTEVDPAVARMGDIPAQPGQPALSEEEKGYVMHAQLPILGGHVLHGTDMLPSLGHRLAVGNNVTLNLECDTREDADRLYAALSDGGSESTGMRDELWGYWGCTLDRFGVRWMFNAPSGS